MTVVAKDIKNFDNEADLQNAWKVWYGECGWAQRCAFFLHDEKGCLLMFPHPCLHTFRVHTSRLCPGIA